MSANRHIFPSASITLAAATETDLVGADGLDVSDSDRAEFGIDNTGTHPLTPAVYYQLVPDGKWYPDATIFAAITNATKGRVVLPVIQALRIRVTGLSASGTTCTVEGRWVRGAR